MGILDRAAQRLGYTRQDAAPSPGPAPAQPRQWRADDFAGVLSAYSNRLQYGGTGSTLYAPEELYGSDGLASLIVDRPAEDAVARGFKIEGDEGEDVLNEMDRLDAGPVLTDALRAARLHGGAAIMPLMDDGLPLDAPIDEGRIRSITDLMLYPATAISMREERHSDPTQPNYGWPTHYGVRPRYGLSFVVHETRLLTVSGDPLPFNAAQNARLPWLGRGVLEGCYADLCRYRDALRISKEILFRKQQAVHSLSGLGEMLQAGLDDIVAKRLETADMARNILTAVSIDAEDKFQILDSSLGGIDSVIREYKVALSASSGIPIPILFGELNRSLASTGDGELENYHQRLRQMQERSLRPVMEQLAGLIWAQRSLPSKEPNHWRLEFNQLWSPTEKEMAEVEKIKAEARKIGMDGLTTLLDGGLASVEEVRDLSRLTAYPELPEGPPPEPPPLPEPEPIEPDSSTTPQVSSEDAPGAGAQTDSAASR